VPGGVGNEGPPTSIDPGKIVIEAIGSSCDRVFINNIPLSATPVTVIVSPGSHKVYCVWPSGRMRTQIVTVNASQTKTVTFVF
jgi:hypothetical protein